MSGRFSWLVSIPNVYQTVILITIISPPSSISPKIDLPQGNATWSVSTKIPKKASMIKRKKRVFEVRFAKLSLNNNDTPIKVNNINPEERETISSHCLHWFLARTYGHSVTHRLPMKTVRHNSANLAQRHWTYRHSVFDRCQLGVATLHPLVLVRP